MSFSQFLTVSLNALFYIWLRFLSWFVPEGNDPRATTTDSGSGVYAQDGVLFIPSSPPEFTRPQGTHENLGARKLYSPLVMN